MAKTVANESPSSAQKSPEFNDFEKAVRVVMKYLAENHHPHCVCIVTSTDAELLEGKMSVHKIYDYIQD